VLERLGACVLSTDAVVHELYGDREVVDAVTERFGEDVAQDGAVARGVLAQRAFATPEDRAWLEQLLWPRVGRRIVSWRAELEERTPPPRAGVVEVPLLFEAGMEGAFNVTIAVVAPEELREQRANERGHQAVDERTSRQLTQDEKASRATHRVVNDGTVEDLQERLAGVLAQVAG
jgi:dephospho-CoA kinase